MSGIASVRSQCLFGIAAAFKANLERTATAALAPAQLSFMVRRDQIFYDTAIFTATKNPEIKLTDFLKGEASAAVTEHVKRQFREFLAQDEAVRDNLMSVFGVSYIETLLERHPAVKESINALFESIVLGSWTAFECLAADAWVQAVNNSAELRIKVNASSHVKKRGEENDGSENKFKIDPIADFGGSLIEAKRVSFQTLRNIKQFYGVILDKKSKDHIFKESANGYVSALSEVRNVLTHKAGIVDSQFAQRVGEFPELIGFKEGDALLLNGELVKKLRAASAQTAASILSIVDDIISPLPVS